MAKIENLEEKIDAVVEVLTHLASGQGHSSLALFDAGVSEAEFSVASYLERDGKIFRKDSVSEDDFRAILRKFCSSSTPHTL